MSDYTIAFDFPEGDGDPWFASFIGDVADWTPSLASAEMFDSEDTAERFLAISYGPWARQYGVVVEVVA